MTETEFGLRFFDHINHCFWKQNNEVVEQMVGGRPIPTDGKKLADEMLPLTYLQHANVLIWHGDAYNAAVEDCESFSGSILTEPECKIWPQIWMLPAAEFNNRAATQEHLHLSDTDKLVAVFVQPMVSEKPEVDCLSADESDLEGCPLGIMASYILMGPETQIPKFRLIRPTWQDRPINGAYTDIIATLNFLNSGQARIEERILPRHYRRAAELKRRTRLPDISVVELQSKHTDLVLTLKRMPYSEYLQTGHWQTVREAALERAAHKCQMCAAVQELHVHHNTYVRRGEELPTDVIAVCKKCHAKHHGKTAGQ